MKPIEIVSIILIVISVFILLAIIKFIISEKHEKNKSYAQIFLSLIKTCFYRKHVSKNDYPHYSGNLERKDVAEFVEFINHQSENEVW